MLARTWRNWNSHICVVGMQNSTVTLEKQVSQFIRNLKTVTTLWVSQSTLRYLPKRHKSLHPRDLPCGSNGKESACNAGDPGSVSGLGRSSGERNGNPLQNSCLENPMDRRAWGLQSVRSQRVGHDWATNTTTPTWRPVHNAHSSFIYSSQNLETIQKAIKK